MIYVDFFTGRPSFIPFTGGGGGGDVTSVAGRTGAVVLTKSDVGLGNVDNTSDVNKPISTATQTSLNSKADLVGGIIPTTQIPAIAITTKLASVGSQAAMLALSGQEGDWTIRTDLGTTWVITGADPTQLSNWTALSYPTAPVQSVNGQTGVIVLTASDVGAVPTTRTVNGHALSGNIVLTFNDLSFTGSNLTSIATRNFSDLQNKPTTLSAYGITDAIVLNGSVVSSPASVYFAGKLAFAGDDFIDFQLARYESTGPLMDQNIYSTLTHTGAGTYVRYVACWLRGDSANGLVDLTPIAVYNSWDVNRGIILISPRHFISYGNSMPPNGTTIRFVTNTNTVVSRTVSASSVVNTGIGVGMLDSDVPSTIAFAKVLPASVSLKSQIGRALAFVSMTDQTVWTADQGSPSMTTGLTTVGKSAYLKRALGYKTIGYPVTYDDAGTPYLYVFDRELVFAGPANEDKDGFWSVSFKHDQINTAMTSLGGGYQLTDYTSTVLPPRQPTEIPYISGLDNPYRGSSTMLGVNATDPNGNVVLDVTNYSLGRNAGPVMGWSGSAFNFGSMPQVGGDNLDVALGLSNYAYNDLSNLIEPDARNNLGLSDLSGVSDSVNARINLGLAIGTNVQAYNSVLTTWAGITPTTVGQNLVTVSNPGAVRYIRIDATNGITLRTAAQQLGDLGGEPALGNPGADGYLLSSTTAGLRSWIAPPSGGDASTNTSTSVDSELALFSGTLGKTLKRATGSGIVKLASGVLGFGATTSDLSEGSNLYYTDARVRLNRLDQMAVPTANVSMGSNRITNVTDPSGAQDAATKNYVDTLLAGLRKMSVRVATTAVGTLATSFENGDTIDGITLATGDYILIKNQAAAAENGIYVVNASGAPTRATYADSAAEIDGLMVVVEDGTANSGTIWISTSDVTTLGTDAITFTQFNKATDLVAGAALTSTGLTWDVAVDGSTIEVSADALRVKDAGITLAKMANLAANSIIGNNTGSAATPIALTAAQTKTLLSLNNVENTALSTWAGTANIITLGTITTGTWNGTAIGAAYLPGSFSGFGNPSGLIGMSAVNGSATTGTRSDATHAIDPAIAPIWTGLHTFKYSDAATSTVVDIVTYGKNSSGTPAASFGGGLLFNLQSSTTADRNAARLSWYWTTATDASRASAAKIALVTGAGSLTDVLYIFGSGGMSLNANSDPGAGIFNANTGFRIGNAAASGNVLRGNGTNFVSAVLSEADVSFTDITTNNVSTSKHGFAPKLPNDATKYLDGTGAYSVPAGGSSAQFATTSSVTVGNTTTETSLKGTVNPSGADTLAANALAAGKSLRLTAYGYMSSKAATPGLVTWRFKLGSTTWTSTQTVPAVGTTSVAFRLEVILTCRTAGASGTVIVEGVGQAAASASANWFGTMINTSTTTLDTTATQAVDLTWQWATADVNNTITCTNMIMQIL